VTDCQGVVDWVGGGIENSLGPGEYGTTCALPTKGRSRFPTYQLTTLGTKMR
jgi:hypothetical protein